MNAPRDALDLPLAGIRTVEANAGTGKTFTIAALYLRLILEQALAPEEIVVATFTRAATAELAERLRDWLASAVRVLDEVDPERERADESGELAMIRRIIRQASAQIGDDALRTLRQRARDAALAIDTAQISTLHGFCFRVLGEFGFEAGSSLRRPELIEDMRALDLEIVRDFWRRGSGDVATAALLAGTWGNPESLAKQVGDPRWADRVVELPRPDTAACTADFESACARVAAWGKAERAEFEAELQRCVKTAGTCTTRMRAWDDVHTRASGSSIDAMFEEFDAKAVANIGADSIEGLQPKGVRPEGQVFDDIAALANAHAALVAARVSEQARRGAELLNAARTVLEQERARRLGERGLMSHDQAVRTLEQALAKDGAGRVIAAIRRRWRAALIDEFQDTDSAQWNVVRKLFGDTTLVLVGDPKQAIYGFRGGDVFAWRKATERAAGERLALTTSYRSGTPLCNAVNALFKVDGAFVDSNIDYLDVAASERSQRSTVLRDGAALPGIECWSFDASDLGQPDTKAASQARARTALEQRSVRWVAAMLRDAMLRHGNGECEHLQPKHIAVLVNSNREAAALQAALGAAGIPAASTLRASVYASEEADDLALLLEALAEPADAARARSAWASRLIGKGASEIASSLADDDDAPQRQATEWATSVRHHGVLAWLHRLVAAAAPRLLEQPEGRRRVSNYLQLAELLQEAQTTGLGAADLANQLARRRTEAGHDGDAESASLRLDTDADAVTVSTVHAAKGLEYDVVLLPYAGIAKDPSKRPTGVALQWYHDDDGNARVALGSGPLVAAAEQRARAEALAEDVRKLYVAATRARALCVLPWGRINGTEHGALFHLLHEAGREERLALGDAECAAALADLRQRAPDAIGVVAWNDIASAQRWQAGKPQALATEPRSFTRSGLERDWSVWSFSRLVRGGQHAVADTLPGSGDGDAATADAGAAGGSQLGGARFGSAVHEVFERTDFAAWRDADSVPSSQRALIERALADQGVATGAALPQAVDAVGAMLRDALNARLACGARLADITTDARRAEIEFHLSLAPTDSDRLFALLHRHGYQKQRRSVAAERLRGLLTGKIDLTFRHDARYWIVDWKTNRCPPYDDNALDAEITRHDYDLQWIIYTLALHRWLGTTLPGYDYERDFGGVYYLFVRGMRNGAGVRADRPERALIDALDAMFLAPRREAA